MPDSAPAQMFYGWNIIFCQLAVSVVFLLGSGEKYIFQAETAANFYIEIFKTVDRPAVGGFYADKFVA